MSGQRKPSEDLWFRTLSRIHSVFGRMEYLARIRNSNSGHYEHHGLAMLFSEDEAEQALRSSHIQVFHEWLLMDLEHRKADLDLFLCEQPTDRRTMVETWKRLKPYLQYVPVSASPAQIVLYQEELEVLLDLIRAEYEAGVRGPGGSPPR